jgi:hypothetical protein
MCIYCGTKHHRKIYKEHFGPIPKGMDIHHIDGNHSNNDPDNLKAVTIREHYNIHYSQGDYGAAFMVAKRLILSEEERSRIASLAAKKANAEGKAGTPVKPAGSVARRAGHMLKRTRLVYSILLLSSTK